MFLVKRLWFIVLSVAQTIEVWNKDGFEGTIINEARWVSEFYIVVNHQWAWNRTEKRKWVWGWGRYEQASQRFVAPGLSPQVEPQDETGSYHFCTLWTQLPLENQVPLCHMVYDHVILSIRLNCAKPYPFTKKYNAYLNSIINYKAELILFAGLHIFFWLYSNFHAICLFVNWKRLKENN